MCQNSCKKCQQELLNADKSLLAEMVIQFGDKDNAPWCQLCRQLFVDNTPLESRVEDWVIVSEPV